MARLVMLGQVLSAQQQPKSHEACSHAATAIRLFASYIVWQNWMLAAAVG